MSSDSMGTGPTDRCDTAWSSRCSWGSLRSPGCLGPAGSGELGTHKTTKSKSMHGMNATRFLSTAALILLLLAATSVHSQGRAGTAWYTRLHT